MGLAAAKNDRFKISGFRGVSCAVCRGKRRLSRGRAVLVRNSVWQENQTPRCRRRGCCYLGMNAVGRRRKNITRDKRIKCLREPKRGYRT